LGTTVHTHTHTHTHTNSIQLLSNNEKFHNINFAQPSVRYLQLSKPGESHTIFYISRQFIVLSSTKTLTLLVRLEFCFFIRGCSKKFLLIG
ncbi:MAG: hypothetical protein ACI8RD_007785, partial [Bacillariaceae sp.]